MERLMNYEKKLKCLSRQLRHQMTDAERKLWSKIRNKQIGGMQFYRQKPIGNYIVDFFCSKVKLIIEIDGGQHYERKNELRDGVRTDYLISQGFKVLRFTNLDILKNIDNVVNKIASEINPS